MRLLWLLDSLAVGGAERLAAIFARQAAANGISLHVAVLSVIDGNPLAAELKAAGVPVTVLRARNLRDIRQSHGAPRCPEAAKYGQALFQ